MVFTQSTDMVDRFRLYRDVKPNGMSSNGGNGDSSFMSNSMELDQTAG